MDHQLTVLYTAEQIHARVHELAHRIARTMPQDLAIVSLLRGSFVFTSDLIRALHGEGVRPQIDFMTLGSYHKGSASTGSITMQRDITEDVKGRFVLLLDDILESGRTLTYARDLLVERGAAEIKIGVFLEKPGKRTVQIAADFVGFTVPDKFVVGYGLDYANFYRELPFIAAIDIH
jgi:hypoxanthine phosphoribosyltransferase